MNDNAVFLREKVVKLVELLPAVHEKAAYGTPAFYVEKKLFTRLKEDGQTLVVYNDERDDWIASNPDTYFFTDHYKDHPMLLIDLKTVLKQELKTLLINSWKTKASKKLLKEFNG